MSVDRRVSADAHSAAENCARHILSILTEARSLRPFATLALSGGKLTNDQQVVDDGSLTLAGGSTPKLMFEAMVRAQFQWDRVHLFWVDERAVPPDNSRSNYKLAFDALIAPARIPESQIHRIRAELEPAAAAKAYVDEIRDFFHLAPGQVPAFDVVQRGMGPDAHTASLFPGEVLIQNREGIAAAVHVEKFSEWRITLLPAVLAAAHHTEVLVTGDDKAEAARSVFEEPYDPLRYPAQLGREGAAGVVWFMDRAAAALLKD